MCSLILFSLYSNDLLKCKNRIIKTCFQRRFKFINTNVIYKKKLICKEKYGIVTKVKLSKIKKHNQLYFGTVLASYCYNGDNA